MRLRSLIVLSSLSFFLTNCTLFHHTPAPCVPTVVKKPVTLTTASGIKYTITTKGCGIQPMPGDQVKVNYTGKFTNDTVFDSSVGKTPFEFKLGKHQVIKGWDEGLALLHVGDKATFVIPPALGYGSQAMGPIKPNTTLVFDVELLDVKEGVRRANTKGKDTVTTPSGLKIIYLSDTKLPEFIASNTDNMPVNGNKVKVHYSGFLLDGTCFDSSVERGKPFDFNLGAGMVIKGWDLGIAMLHKGEKAQLIIPSDLAYGDRGHPGVIPPKATLIFDVELVDFTK
jgi:peptidylprolyl isomerase